MLPFVLFIFLFYSIFISRKPWQKYLKTQIENVLEENEPNKWLVGNYIPINNPFTLSSACYEAKLKKSGEVYKVVIIRIQTFYGPVSAIFTVDKEEKVDFIAYSSLHGRVATQLNNSQADKRLEYWKKKIPEIIREKE